MAIEDILHPLLKTYVSAPQWVKSSLGRAYSLLPPELRYGRAHALHRREEAIRDTAEIWRIARVKLEQTLRWAVDTVPAYRHLAPLVSSGAEPESWLAEFPLTTKEQIKADPERYCSTAMPARARLPMFTGGSTAQPMRFYLHRNVSRPKESAYIAAFDARAGVGRDEVILALRGRSVPSAREPGGRLWMYEPIKRHLILSSDHLESRYMPQYVEAMRQWRPHHIQAFPSAVYPLARWFSEHPVADVTGRIRSIQLTSENVYDFQMRLLRKVFRCPVFTHYGHSERVLMAASLGDDDRYFFWPLYGYFELVDEHGRRITTPGVAGEIVGTGFDNRVMPFVRYRTGDVAVLDAGANPALAGFPVCSSIEGRLQEFVVCRDRRLISVTTLGAAHFEELANVEAIQYEQSVPGRIILKVVTRQGLAATAIAAISRAVCDKTQGGCEVEIRCVDSIPRTGRGKLRMLIQHLDISAYLGAACPVPEHA